MSLTADAVADVLERLRALGIEAPTVEHPPVFTVAEAKAPALAGGLRFLEAAGHPPLLLDL